MPVNTPGKQPVFFTNVAGVHDLTDVTIQLHVKNKAGDQFCYQVPLHYASEPTQAALNTTLQSHFTELLKLLYNRAHHGKYQTAAGNTAGVTYSVIETTGQPVPLQTQIGADIVSYNATETGL